MDLCVHSPIRLHGVVLNYLSTGTTFTYSVIRDFNTPEHRTGLHYIDWHETHNSYSVGSPDRGWLKAPFLIFSVVVLYLIASPVV
jgi:hypothetical protein